METEYLFPNFEIKNEEVCLGKDVSENKFITMKILISSINIIYNEQLKKDMKSIITDNINTFFHNILKVTDTKVNLLLKTANEGKYGEGKTNLISPSVTPRKFKKISFEVDLDAIKESSEFTAFHSQNILKGVIEEIKSRIEALILYKDEYSMALTIKNKINFLRKVHVQYVDLLNLCCHQSIAEKFLNFSNYQSEEGKNFIKKEMNKSLLRTIKHYSCGGSFYYLYFNFEFIIFCLKCKETQTLEQFNSLCVKLECQNCFRSFSSKLNKCMLYLKEIENLDESEGTYVTNEIFHCGVVRNTHLNCNECSNALLYYKDINRVLCLTCAKIWNFGKEYTTNCDLCFREYQAKYKKYDADEYEIVKQVIKINLKDKLRARPQFLKKKNYICSCVIGPTVKYFHSNKCPGLLFKGILDNNNLVICNDCMYTTTENWMIWTCPKCGVEFNEQGVLNKKDNYIEDSNKGTNKSISTYFDSSPIKKKNVYGNGTDKKEDIKLLTNNDSPKNKNNKATIDKDLKDSKEIKDTKEVKEIKDTKEEKESILIKTPKKEEEKIKDKDAVENTVQNLGDVRKSLSVSISEKESMMQFSAKKNMTKIFENSDIIDENDELDYEIDDDEEFDIIPQTSRMGSEFPSNNTTFIEITELESVSRKCSSNYLNTSNLVSNISNVNIMSASKVEQPKKTIVRSYSNARNLGSSNYLFNKKPIENDVESNPLKFKKDLKIQTNFTSNLEKMPEKGEKIEKYHRPVNVIGNVLENTKLRSTSTANNNNFQFERKNTVQESRPTRNIFENAINNRFSSKVKDIQMNNDTNQNINININIKGVQNLTLNNVSSTANLKRNTDNLIVDKIKVKPIDEKLNNNTIDINVFKISKQIGEGTFAKIYKVEETSTGKEFALKKFIGHSKEELKNVYREFEFLSKHPHNNLLKIYGMTSYQLDNTTHALYILMENAECDWYKEIRNRITLNKLYKEKEILNILYQLISALAFLQREGISHRDIKPQNILLYKGGVFKIADFGEAKVINTIENLQHTVRGSELYMSPLLFGGLNSKVKKVAHNPYKSDVFSLGMSVLLATSLNFELLYSVRQNSDPKKVKQNVDLFLKNRGYSNHLISVLMVMTKTDEKRRPDFIELESILMKK